MSSTTELLREGIKAVRQGRYADAIAPLLAFSQQCTNPQSMDFLQAQRGLLKAYQATGQIDAARDLCQQLLAIDDPALRALANKTLAALANPETASSAEAAASAPTTAPEPAPPTPEQPERLDLLKQGIDAVRRGDYAAAIVPLQKYSANCTNQGSNYFLQAQRALVKSYQALEQVESAIALCERFRESEHPVLKAWANQCLAALAPVAPAPPEATANAAPAVAPAATAETPASLTSSSRQSAGSLGARSGRGAKSTSPPPTPLQKAGRAAKAGIKLTMAGVGGSLLLASTVTLSLLFGMVFVLILGLVLIQDSSNPTLGLGIALSLTLLFNLVSFFIAPVWMDLMQAWLYGTRWVTLSDIERRSPEAGRTIRRVCAEYKLQQPRLGLISDQNPTAFTYGSLPNASRLVVSQGLFTYLDDDEIAAVYAHELGHIVHWDFAVMTLASTLVQTAYLFYVYIRRIAHHLGKKQREAATNLAMVAYVFYLMGTYLLLYLSRVREYFADHFAAEVTGNPNALSRALVKIAYGILEEGKRTQELSRLVEGTRALGIYDARAAGGVGTAYRVVSEPAQMGRVFLWDLFNPWAWWMELNSTHPLTGKRVRALATYAEQLGLDIEFDMGKVVAEGKKLNKSKLYGHFVLDVVLYLSPKIGFLVGVALGITLFAWTWNWGALLGMMLLGFGVGQLCQTLALFPNFGRAPQKDILALMSDPYASPLRGQPVKLEGTVIGRGDAGYRFGSDLKFQDATGMVFIRYSSRFGPLGNFLFGAGQAEGFVNREVSVTGWFRRGVMSWVDLIQLRRKSDGRVVNSYHRFWGLLLAIGAIVLSFLIMANAPRPQGKPFQTVQGPMMGIQGEGVPNLQDEWVSVGQMGQIAIAVHTNSLTKTGTTAQG
ncbi:M48 family metalloprotease [Trichothermofontia sp.]